MMNSAHAEQEVMNLVTAWVAAESRPDTIFLKRTLTDDCVEVGPLGFTLTKQEWVARLQSGDLRYHTLALDEVTVRSYGEAAIGRLTQDAAYRGSPIKAQLRTTLVFIHQREQWQLAGLQLSPIGQPPSFAR
jgi:ketosteroid isomerase-like protein